MSHSGVHNSHYKDGRRKTRLYRTWLSMKSRCGNTKCKDYPRYGERGITVCTEWYDFSSFRNWAISVGYNDDLTIDRVCNDGNYEPSNCRFIPRENNVSKDKSKPVAKYTLDGLLIATYPSARSAEEQTGILHQSISKVCRGEMKKTHGFMWSWVKTE